MTDAPSPWDLRHGDSLDLLDDEDALPDNSVHAIVTDPPYGINFMGESWDEFDPKEYQAWCEEWAGKALRVLKPGGHLLAFSGSRSHHRLFTGVENVGFEIRDTIDWLFGKGFSAGSAQDVSRHLSGEDAERFDGWRYGLMPGAEYITLARKPVEGSTSESVSEHHVGVLNIPECRVSAGRYPKNVVCSEAIAPMLDSMGPSSEGGEKARSKDFSDGGVGNLHPGYRRPNTSAYANPSEEAVRSYGDSGGVSRFFYQPKASPSERTHNGEIDNNHPCVKPLDLMQWLVRLVTAEGQTVLDPFTGSGTTGVACLKEGRQFVGIERESEYYDLTLERLNHTLEGQDQQALSDYATADDD